MKKTVYRVRRDIQKEREEALRHLKKLEYRSSLQEYSRAVKRAKLESWRRFLTSHGNSEPWGIAYKLQTEKFRVKDVFNTLRHSSNESTKDFRETASLLLDDHVSDDRKDHEIQEQRAIRESARIVPETEDISPITNREVLAALKTMKKGKAPGPYLIEVIALKVASKVILELVRLFNECLR